MSETLLKYAQKFLYSRMTPEAFSNSFIMLWDIEQDERIDLKDSKALRHCLSEINSVSETFDSKAYELDPLTSDLKFRHKITNHIQEYRKNKRNKKYEDIVFHLELLHRKTNTDTGTVSLVSKIYVILRHNIEQARADAVNILNNGYMNETIFSNEQGHIIHETPVEVVSVRKSGSLGAEWLVESAMDEYGCYIDEVDHLSPDDLPLAPAPSKNEKIVFKLELLYRWINTETGSTELVTKLFIILRESLEDAKKDAKERLAAVENFRNDDGVVIREEPVEVVSVQSEIPSSSTWLIESAVADYGFEAGVVRHRSQNKL